MFSSITSMADDLTLDPDGCSTPLSEIFFFLSSEDRVKSVVNILVRQHLSSNLTVLLEKGLILSGWFLYIYSF